jgi:LuxR family transcriptional regulator, maltose regulon positive regulatory protein
MEAFASVAKFTPPATEGLIPRPRLFRLLDEACSRPVTWITGPPGTGKTMLIAGYVKTLDLPLIWYRLDEADSDPAAFFPGLVQAVRPILSDNVGSMPTLTAEYQRTLPAFTKLFFQRLFNALPKSFFLVLDNFHLLEKDTGVPAYLFEMLFLLPPGARTLVASRGFFPQELTKMKVQRRMSFLSWEDLRFTPEESKTLLGPEEFPDGVYRLLYEKTSGWAAGLVLFGESLRRGGEIRGGENDATPWIPMREVFDYFAVELFQKIRPDIKEFLIKTSFLRSMTVDMATVMTGSTQAGEILYGLYRNNYLTSCHVSPNPEYEYHPLFSRFLQHMASREFPPLELRDMKCRAAAILESSGKLDCAAGLLKAAGEYDRLASLIHHHAKILVSRGRFGSLKKWLSMLPAAYRQDDPWLEYWLAVCSSLDDPAGARALFGEVFDRFKESGDGHGMFSAWCGAVETFMYDWNDFHALDGLIDSLERMLQQGMRPEGELGARTAQGMAMALCYRRPEHPQFHGWLEKALAGFDGGVPGAINLPARFIAAYHHLWSGDFGRLQTVAGTIFKAVQETDVPIFHQLNSKWLEAMMKSLRAERWEEVLATVEEGLELGARYGIHFWDVQLLGQGVFAALALGDLRLARESLSRLEASAATANRFAQGYFHYTAAMLHCCSEDHLLAEQHARTAMEIAGQVGSGYCIPYYHLARAQTLHGTGEYDRAEELMEEAARFVALSKGSLQELIWLACRAYFDLDGGHRERALEALRKGFALGSRQGYTSLFWWCRPKMMARLCAAALKNGIEVEYAKALIRRQNLFPEPPPLEIEDWPWPFRIRTLGGFELIREGEGIPLHAKKHLEQVSLLKVLAGTGQEGASEEVLSSILWPESGGDADHERVRSLLSSVRELLGADEVVVAQEGRVRLNQRLCWVDSQAFLELCRRVQDMGREDGGAALGPGPMGLSRAARDLYRGQFLPSDLEYVWTIRFRERLRTTYRSLIDTMGSTLESVSDWEAAYEHYLQAIEADALNEEHYRRGILCAEKLRRPEEARRLFDLCRERVRSRLGSEPARETLALARTLGLLE